LYRGANEIEIYVDDIIIYRGYLRKAIEQTKNISKNKKNKNKISNAKIAKIPEIKNQKSKLNENNKNIIKNENVDFHQTILFTNNPLIIEKEKDFVFDINESNSINNVVFIDNSVVLSNKFHHQKPLVQRSNSRPMTSVKKEVKK
jgi:hypothetical protein